MKYIKADLTDEEYNLLNDILGHVGYDKDEAKTMNSLCRKLKSKKKPEPICKIRFRANDFPDVES